MSAVEAPTAIGFDDLTPGTVIRVAGEWHSVVTVNKHTRTIQVRELGKRRIWSTVVGHGETFASVGF